MTGNDSGSQRKLGRIAKFFDASTIEGRRNWVLATYAGIAAIYFIFKLRPKKQPAVTDT